MKDACCCLSSDRKWITVETFLDAEDIVADRWLEHVCVRMCVRVYVSTHITPPWEKEKSCVGSVLVEGDQNTWHGVRHECACVRMCPLLVSSGMLCVLMLMTCWLALWSLATSGESATAALLM